jgi:hypothetical protein
MRRTLIELLHIAAGVIGTALIASLAAWAVPLSRQVIWDVAYVAMLVVIFMGIRPLRVAWRADHGDNSDIDQAADARD